jgi:lipopolysaccharide/colanic/teichoic acid biosynthesis glycosyltransferase
VALLVKSTSRGPVFYVQDRMGYDGKIFRMIKFRTMSDDAERHTGEVWAQPDDPRRTRVGAVLRHISLDELPQLWNVLKGDMSLVGPRPERPVFVEEFRQLLPRYMLRHRVKAGMTGWAQVQGWRGNTSLEKRLEHDLYYIQHWSLLIDVKILWLTLWRGFVHDNAY